MIPEDLNLNHLIAMSDARGLFEHSKYAKPRREHGYCVDDVARGIILLERCGSVDPQFRDLFRTYFNFLLDSQSNGGHFRNRCSEAGIWTSPAQMGDHWGHALWALGTVANRESEPEMAEIALRRFESSAHHRTRFLRPMIYASLGAAQILDFKPDHVSARRLMHETLAVITLPEDNEWPWPEERLSYGNAVIPEFLMLAGRHLKDTKLLERGLSLLEWLVDIETTDDHFSVTSTNGWRTGEVRPAFDQQPIELAAMVDACATAFELTRDPEWLYPIRRGSEWFEGSNDLHIPMYDPTTGAGFDGITPSGRNENQGAESTLSYLSVQERKSSLLGLLL